MRLEMKLGVSLIFHTLIYIAFVAKIAIADEFKYKQIPTLRKPSPYRLVNDFKIGGDVELNGRWRCEEVFIPVAPKLQLSDEAQARSDCSIFNAGSAQAADSKLWDIKIMDAKLTVALCNMHTAFIHASNGTLETKFWNSTRRLCSDQKDTLVFQLRKIRYYFRVDERLYFFDAAGDIMFSFTFVSTDP